MLSRYFIKIPWFKYIGLLISVFVAGCYESTEVTLHEPGVYKGKIDKHDQTQAERDEILKKRIIAVQTDR